MKRKYATRFSFNKAYQKHIVILHIFTPSRTNLSEYKQVGIFIASAVDIKSHVPTRKGEKQKRNGSSWRLGPQPVSNFTHSYTIWAGNSE